MNNAAELLIETLARCGVDTIYGLPGDGINGIMEAIRTDRQDSALHPSAARRVRRVHGQRRMPSSPASWDAVSPPVGPGAASAEWPVRREVRWRARDRNHRCPVSRSHRYVHAAGRGSVAPVFRCRRLQRAGHERRACRERRHPRVPHGPGETRRLAFVSCRSMCRRRRWKKRSASSRNRRIILSGRPRTVCNFPRLTR